MSSGKFSIWSARECPLEARRLEGLCASTSTWSKRGQEQGCLPRDVVENTLVNCRALSMDSGTWYHAHVKLKSVFTSMQNISSNLQAFTSSRKNTICKLRFLFASICLCLITTHKNTRLALVKVKRQTHVFAQPTPMVVFLSNSWLL